MAFFFYPLKKREKITWGSAINLCQNNFTMLELLLSVKKESDAKSTILTRDFEKYNLLAKTKFCLGNLESAWYGHLVP